jgi:hypothetical protein
MYTTNVGLGLICYLFGLFVLCGTERNGTGSTWDEVICFALFRSIPQNTD